MKRTRRTIQKTDYIDFALAICMGEENVALKYNVAPGTVNNYISYAKGSFSNRDMAKKAYDRLNKRICELIDGYIDRNLCCNLNYRRFEQTQPMSYKKHEPVPCEPIQLKFDLSQKEDGPVRSTPDKTKAKALAKIKLVWHLQRAIEIVRSL